MTDHARKQQKNQAVENLQRDIEALKAINQGVCCSIDQDDPIESIELDALMSIVIKDLEFNVNQL